MTVYVPFDRLDTGWCTVFASAGSTVNPPFSTACPAWSTTCTTDSERSGCSVKCSTTSLGDDASAAPAAGSEPASSV